MRISCISVRQAAVGAVAMLTVLTVLFVYRFIPVRLGKAFHSIATEQPFTAALILVLAVGFASML